MFKLISKVLILFELILCFQGINNDVYSQIRDSTSVYENKQDDHLSKNFYKTDSIFSFRSSKGYFPSLINNIGEQATSPFHFRGKQWLYTGCAAVITTALIFANKDIDAIARVQKENHPWINKSSPVISKFGYNYGAYSVILFGLASAGLSNEKGVQTSLLATQAMVTSGIWALLTKRFTHGNFPSEHTAFAFSIATVFASQYNENKLVPVLLYSGSTLVGISRLTEHAHVASEVFAGALLGYLSGKEVVHHYNRLHQNQYQAKNKPKAEFTFIQSGNQIGLSVIW